MNIKELFESLTIRETIKIKKLTFIWGGSHTCNVFNSQDEKIDMFTFGNLSGNKATHTEFVNAVNEYTFNNNWWKG